MKFLLPAIVLAITVDLAVAQNISRSAQTVARSAETCGDPASAVPFYRTYVASTFTDHFYTARLNIANQQIRPGGEESTVPFYRVFNSAAWDNLYTTNITERDSALKAGYTNPVDGDAVQYIYPTQICGSVPFYRLYNSVIKDNFYTTSESERLEFLSNQGYADVGIAGYVLPFQAMHCS
ncbi:hypothetical protein DFH08DRAFT_809962 [Mycena albidolilacea]|uniref:DUF5648 domain-containing protein n=1 Tax=Mycena albidolilacea TaxID=1033008 RepID=A0AAD7ERI3_9AGAR|nr:hypothetical protein DFH08DRAFT_809962 [Mycena albidolilacea]